MAKFNFNITDWKSIVFSLILVAFGGSIGININLATSGPIWEEGTEVTLEITEIKEEPKPVEIAEDANLGEGTGGLDSAMVFSTSPNVYILTLKGVVKNEGDTE